MEGPSAVDGGLAGEDHPPLRQADHPNGADGDARERVRGAARVSKRSREAGAPSASPYVRYARGGHAADERHSPDEGGHEQGCPAEAGAGGAAGFNMLDLGVLVDSEDGGDGLGVGGGGHHCCGGAVRARVFGWFPEGDRCYL